MLQQMRPLQAKMRIGLVGHADPAVNLDIGAAIVERRLVVEPFRGGDMARRTGIARISRAGGLIELPPRAGASHRPFRAQMLVPLGPPDTPLPLLPPQLLARRPSPRPP